MPSSQPLDEATILSRFLLQPSSLPTILPYKKFLELLPAATRNDSSLQRTLRKIYTDLQFQRTIDVDNVRANIERECARGGMLKARLRKDVAREMDGRVGEDEAMVIDMTRRPTSQSGRNRHDDSPELTMSKKRKRSIASASEDSADDDEAQNIDGASRPKRTDGSRLQQASPPVESAHSEDEAEVSASENDDSENIQDDSQNEEIPESPISSSGLSPPSSSPPPMPDRHDPYRLDALLDHTFHGPRGLALPSSYTSQQPQSTFHTRASLLSGMASAVASMESEIEELEAEAVVLMGNMQETVGGLSDLRYGRFGARESDGLPSLEESVEEGLRRLATAASGGLR